MGRHIHESYPLSYCLNSKGLFQHGKETNISPVNLVKNENITAIINCAVSYNEDNQEELHAINVALPQKFLQLAVDHDLKFISFGSFFERHSGKYRAKYIETKQKFKAEISNSGYRKAHYLTLEHIYGKYDHKNKFIPSVVEAIKQRNKITLNDPFTIRDFTPVSLVKEAVKYAVSDANAPSFFDVGTSFQSSTVNFVKKLIQYREPGVDTNSFITYGNEVRREFDVVRSSSAENIPEALKVSSKKVNDLEQLTFKELFGC